MVIKHGSMAYSYAGRQHCYTVQQNVGTTLDHNTGMLCINVPKQGVFYAAMTTHSGRISSAQASCAEGQIIESQSRQLLTALILVAT